MENPGLAVKSESESELESESESKLESESESKRKCVACDEATDLMRLNCGHKFICRKCFAETNKTSFAKQCVVCRQDVVFCVYDDDTSDYKKMKVNLIYKQYKLLVVKLWTSYADSYSNHGAPFAWWLLMRAIHEIFVAIYFVLSVHFKWSFVCVLLAATTNISAYMSPYYLFVMLINYQYCFIMIELLMTCRFEEAKEMLSGTTYKTLVFTTTLATYVFSLIYTMWNMSVTPMPFVFKIYICVVLMLRIVPIAMCYYRFLYVAKIARHINMSINGRIIFKMTFDEIQRLFITKAEYLTKIVDAHYDELQDQLIDESIDYIYIEDA